MKQNDVEILILIPQSKDATEERPILLYHQRRERRGQWKIYGYHF